MEGATWFEYKIQAYGKVYLKKKHWRTSMTFSNPNPKCQVTFTIFRNREESEKNLKFLSYMYV